MMSDAHLLRVLEEVPNDILLAALAGDEAEDTMVCQRICEALPLASAKHFLKELASFTKPTLAATERSRATIITVVARLAHAQEIHLLNLRISRHFAS